MAVLEGHYKDLCDIEFTIERGKLWMLQTRVGKRTAAAAFIIAGQLVDEGVIDLDEALHRVNGAQLAQLMFPTFGETDAKPLAKGIAPPRGAPAGKAWSPGAAAARWANRVKKVIPVRLKTTPTDRPGMTAAAGIRTSRGGKTGPAAWFAPALGRTCSGVARR